MPEYGNNTVIKNFAYFDSLPLLHKQEYIDTVQRTYHVSLQAIGRQMKGATSSFDNYLMDVGVHGNRGEASKKTSHLWPAFCAGAADIYGRPVYEYGSPIPKPVPPKSYPTTLEITGAPQAVLDLLSSTLRTLAINDGRKYQIGLTIQEVA